MLAQSLIGPHIDTICCGVADIGRLVKVDGDTQLTSSDNFLH